MESQKNKHRHTASQVRRWLRIVIFGTDTPSGKAFDVALIFAILMSVTVVMLDSVREIRGRFGFLLSVLEWLFTGLFTIEYFVRIYISDEKKKFVLSWVGIIDLLAILPAWLFFVLPGGQFLSTFRIIRVIRIFRILEMSQFTEPSKLLRNAITQSFNKILVFLFAVMLIVSVVGSLMYVIEGPENGFVSIPKSVYWAVVTVTTVGYGDISPQTALGQFLSGLTMIIGYSIIAVPTGIIAREIVDLPKSKKTSCPSCGGKNPVSANFCSSCGTELFSE